MTKFFCCTRIISCLLYCFCAPVLVQEISAQQTATSSSASWQVAPFLQEVFVENKGQYDYMQTGESRPVLYGIDNGLYKIAIHPDGFTWRLEVLEFVEGEFENSDEPEEEEDPDRPDGGKVNVHPYLVNITWEGANRDVQVKAENQASEYFTYGAKENEGNPIDHAAGYKKIIFKNLYPGIDAEVQFKLDNGKQGIKYSYIIHPGGDPSVIKMKYEGAELALDVSGSLRIITAAGTLIETAPLAYYALNGEHVPVSFLTNKNYVQFKCDGFDRSQTLVIDPFQIIPTTLTPDLKAFDVANDAAGNIYVFGGFSNYKLQKYDAAGNPIWTYTSVYSGINGAYGDLAVDQAGNAFLIDAFQAFSTMSLTKVDPAGAQVFNLLTPGTEHFNLVFNCNSSQLILSKYSPGQYANINTTTGAIGPATTVNPSEIRSMCVAPDGTIYGYTCLLPIGSLLACTPAFTPTGFGTIGSGYVTPELGVLYTNSVCWAGLGWAGQNGLAADNCYVYSTDGSTVHKRNKTTGAILAQVTVPGGVAETNSGIAVDECGNVYVGSQGGVYKYDFNLLQTGFYATGSPVYCVWKTTGNEVLACGNGFVASIAFNGCGPLSCNAVPAINFAVVQPGCTGNNGSATANVTGSAGPFAYAWSTGATTQTVNNLAPGVYTCTVTAACNTITGTVTINPPGSASANISAQTNITCFSGMNGSATVNPTSGTPPFTFNWSPAGGNNATANNLAAGTYTCTVTDSTGCIALVTVTITEPPAMTAVVSTVNTSCGNSTGSATINVSGGSPGYTYLWNPSGQTTQTAINLPAGVYNCTVTDTTGCQEIFQATISNANGPNVTLAAQQDVTCPGGNNGSVSINVTGGAAPYSYSWSSGGNASTESNLIAGNYTCTVTDSAGCFQGFAVTITQPSAFNISTAATPSNCNPGNNGTATINVAGGTGPYSYNWSPSGGNGNTATNLSTGTYTCVVTDNNGCTVVDSVTVTQPAGITTTSIQADVSCFGGSNGSAAITTSGGSGNYSYAWTPSVSNSANASGLVAGSYTCIVSDLNSGCTSGLTITITEPPAIALVLTSIPVSCNGGNNGTASVTASGGTGSYFFSWAPFGNPNDTITGLIAGTYTCTVTDANGCAETDSVSVAEPPKLEIYAQDTVTLCQGQTATINYTVIGGTPGYSLNWSPSGPTISPTASGIYTVFATDTNGCISLTDSIHVFINPPLTVQTISPAAICSGAVVGLTAMGSGGDGNYSYTWVSNTTPSTGPNVNASPTVTTTYTVTITDGCGSPPDTATLTVTVYPPPQPTFVLSDTSGCAPFCIDFTNTTSNANTCSWEFGDGGFDTVNCNTNYCYYIPGTYDIVLTIIDNNGCTGTFGVAALVNVYASPTAGFDYGPDEVTILNPQIEFTDQSTGATSWYWNFGDGVPTTSTAQNPVFFYADTGSYAVMQICYNAFGCSDTAMLIVNVEEDATLYIPNAFTPNGDGTNDLFYPQGVGVDEGVYEFWIFDRWGNLIFHSTTWGEGWDGKVQGGTGEIAQEDVYVWKLQYRSVTKKQTREYMGHVSLVK
jgi:gliding motility-associated-like protein